MGVDTIVAGGELSSIATESRGVTILGVSGGGGDPIGTKVARVCLASLRIITRPLVCLEASIDRLET